MELVIDVARELNGSLDVEIDVGRGAEALLFGQDGALDSLGLVMLLVDVEQAVEERLGQSLTLADDAALSQARSPFRSIGSLARYVESRL
ncbi:MAG: acyl carrier protein [Acidimicrobiales bacterium]